MSNKESALVTPRSEREAYVVGFVHRHNQIVMIHKASDRGPYAVRDKWNGPGGRIEPFESERQAMAREMSEETGMDIPPEEWTVAVQMAWGMRKLYFLTAECPAGQEPCTMTDEEVRWRDVGSFHGINVVPNLRWLVPLAFDSDIRKPVILTDVSGDPPR